MREILTEIISILNESSVYLLFGFLAAGILHVVLSRSPRITALFTGRGAKPVFMSTMLGLPMPLCSCSVLPAAMTLRRQGASKGATTSFLISTPETGIDSIALTYGLMDPLMTVYRPFSALVTALTAGFAAEAFGSSDDGAKEEGAKRDEPAADHAHDHHDKLAAEAMAPPADSTWTGKLRRGFTGARTRLKALPIVVPMRFSTARTGVGSRSRRLPIGSSGATRCRSSGGHPR